MPLLPPPSSSSILHAMVMAVQVAARLEAREAELREKHAKDLRRRTGALAEQHAAAMRDLSMRHEEQLRGARQALVSQHTASRRGNHSTHASPSAGEPSESVVDNQFV